MRYGVVIDALSGRVEIGNNVSLNGFAVLLGDGGIRIGNDGSQRKPQLCPSSMVSMIQPHP
ncbi:MULTISPECIES: hypothetical protein [Rhizobium]|nr:MULTISPECIES: hypothetical protein [Rhizobium]MCS0457900.1 hypothetical protein [Rhizobium favelukesii]UFS78955.1 hypothetical protein LPB79_04795 [Rhizobium sp. T136]